MELVRGLPITEFCDKNSLTTKERLELFMSVCQAVQHAHQRGIIHRDIKPSNILVTLHDGQPVPKVIDFGIAKAVNQQLTEKTVFTRYSQMIGTPEYMSPEQAEMSGLDIDTRTDVFSLGVLLYELLTGTTPFDSEYLLSKGYSEMQRIIREEEPLRPSTKVSTLGETLTDVAKHRKTSPELLCKLIRTDLDWIVMKTLEKDRNRRYESVSELAADVKRHLDDEPVLAGRPSTVYRVQKFVKRNRTLCMSSVAIAGILILAVVVSSHQAWVAQKARSDESSARATAELERDRARAAQQQAQQERVQAQSHLYDSLVREAQLTCITRGLGYREPVFRNLQQARDLDVPNKDLVGLRKEAIACLGDFVGKEPKLVLEVPEEPESLVIVWGTLHPSDAIAAFALSDGSILLKDLQSTKDIARFQCEHFPYGMCFANTGNSLLSLHVPNGYSPEPRLADAVSHLFVRVQDGTWVEGRTLEVPNAVCCMSTAAGFSVAVADVASGSAHLVEPLTGGITHEFGLRVDMMVLPPIALTVDGCLLAAGTNDPNSPNTCVVDVWDLKLNERLARLEPGLAGCARLRFSPDRRYLAFLSESGGIVYSTDTFEPVAHFKDQFAMDSDGVFLPGSDVLVLSLKSSQVLFWDCARKENVATFEQPLGDARWISTSADGRTMMSYHYKRAWLYSLDTTVERLTFSAHSAGVPGIAFSPDGSRVASVGKDRTLRVWHSTTGRLDWEQVLDGQGQGVVYAPDGRWLATTDYDRERVCVWNTETKKLLFEAGSGQEGQTWSALFRAGGDYLASAAAHWERRLGSLTVWDCRGGDSNDAGSPFVPRPVRSVVGDPRSLMGAPDGRHFAFVDFNDHDWVSHKLYLSEITETTSPRLITDNICGANQMVSFTPDGWQVVVVDNDRSVVTWDIQTGRSVASFATIPTSFRGEWSREMNMSLSPDGETLALSSFSDRGIDLWHTKTGRLLYSLPERSGVVYWIAWSPDSQRLAVSRSNGEIEIWGLGEVERILADLGLGAVVGKDTAAEERSEK